MKFGVGGGGGRERDVPANFGMTFCGLASIRSFLAWLTAAFDL
jgi:hypothetical protein